MCEMIVWLNDQNGHDKGDILRIEPDNFGWGAKETYAKWRFSGGSDNEWHGRHALIKVDDLKPENLKHLIKRDKTTSRHIWKLDLDKLKPEQRVELIKNHELTITQEQVKRLIRHKISNVNYLGFN